LTTTAGTGSEGFYNEDGTLQHRKVKALARTYMVKTAGTILDNIFNTKSGQYSATWRHDESVKAHSEIYLNNEYWYPNGF
jgi:endoglycosylceramidase